MSGRTRPLALVPGLWELADRQLGVVSRTQLATLGVTRHHVRSQVAAQRWHCLGGRVVALSTGALTAKQWRYVGLLHCGNASVLCSRTSLEVHGLQNWPAEQTDVLVPHGTTVPNLAGVRVHRSRHLTETDVVIRRGWRCTSAERSIVDAASDADSARTAAALVLAALQQKVSAPERVAEHLHQAPARRHARAIARAVDDAIRGAESHAELDVIRLIKRAGLTNVRQQVAIRTLAGLRRVDLAVDLPDGSVLVVEVDGVHHQDPRVRAEDAVKDAAVQAAGYRMLRIPVALVRSDPGRVVEMFRQLA